MSFETLDGISFAAAAWLATYLMHSTLWLASAWLLARAVRSSALAEWIWRAALVGGLVTATLHGRVGGLESVAGVRVARPEPAGAVIAVELPASGVTPVGTPAATVVPAPAGEEAFAAAPTAAFPLRWYHGVAGVWVLGAAAALAHLLLLRQRLRRLLGDRRPIIAGPVAEALDRVRIAARTARDPRLTSSSRLASPVALAGDEICVPARAATELGPRELDTMLAHELAHLERRDPAWARGLSLFERVLFPQPLNRLAARRLEQAAEFLCDERAVEWTGSNVALARCLHEVASWRGASARCASAMVRPASPLVDRVRRALEGTASVPTRAQRAAVASWAVTGLVLLACQGPGISAESGEPAEPIEPAETTVLTVLVPLPADVPPASEEEWIPLDEEVERLAETAAAWEELEREVRERVDLNLVANGGLLSREQLERDLAEIVAARAREAYPSGAVTGTRAALQGKLRVSDTGVEWLEQEAGTIASSITAGPRTSIVEPLPSSGVIVVSSGPRRSAEWATEEGSTLEVLADGSVKAMFQIPMEGRPVGVTQVLATQIRAGDEFGERLHKVLAYAASQMRREPIDAEDPDSPSLPSALVVLEVHEQAPFGTVLEILQACSAQDVGFWNLAFEIPGPDGPVRVKTPLPRDVAAKQGEGPPRIELGIRVAKPGAKVHVETGEPWSGDGPFRFEGRELVYSFSESLPAPGGGTLTGGMAMSSAEAAISYLVKQRGKNPDAVLTLDARPGVVYGDLLPIIAVAREIEMTVRFVGKK